MMGIVHSGSPLSTIAEVLLLNISLRNERLDSLSVSKKEWIGRLLYKGKFKKLFPCQNINILCRLFSC